MNQDFLMRFFRLLIPSEDKDRKYSIREKTLTYDLIGVFDFQGEHAERLKNWNSEQSDAMVVNGNVGDFGAVLEVILASKVLQRY